MTGVVGVQVMSGSGMQGGWLGAEDRTGPKEINLSGNTASSSKF